MNHTRLQNGWIGHKKVSGRIHPNAVNAIVGIPTAINRLALGIVLQIHVVGKTHHLFDVSIYLGLLLIAPMRKHSRVGRRAFCIQDLLNAYRQVLVHLSQIPCVELVKVLKWCIGHIYVESHLCFISKCFSRHQIYP